MPCALSHQGVVESALSVVEHTRELGDLTIHIFVYHTSQVDMTNVRLETCTVDDRWKGATVRVVPFNVAEFEKRHKTEFRMTRAYIGTRMNNNE